MTHPPCLFQAAVELPLSLILQDHKGQWAERGCLVTAVVERVGLDEFDVVMDFRVLEAALTDAIEHIRGRSLQDLGMNGLNELAEKIAKAIAPAIKPLVRLAAVIIRDDAVQAASWRQ
jgi:6-pyruvoyl-tetrahydropterin synthase